jgi:hypothetical protein
MEPGAGSHSSELELECLVAIEGVCCIARVHCTLTLTPITPTPTPTQADGFSGVHVYCSSRALQTGSFPLTPSLLECCGPVETKTVLNYSLVFIGYRVLLPSLVGHAHCRRKHMPGPDSSIRLVMKLVR